MSQQVEQTLKFVVEVLMIIFLSFETDTANHFSMTRIVNEVAKLHRFEPYDQLDEQADAVLQDVLSTLTTSFPDTRKFAVSFLYDNPPSFNECHWHLLIYDDATKELLHFKIYSPEMVASIGRFQGLIIRWPGNNFVMKPLK